MKKIHNTSKTFLSNKYLWCCFFCFTTILGTQAQGVVLTNGSYFVNNGSTKITFSNAGIKNSGVFTAAQSNVTFGGTSYTINTGDSTLRLYQMTVGGQGTKTTGAAITISNLLTIADSTTLDADGAANTQILTLLSTDSATASLGPVTSKAAIPVSGKVLVERYVPGRRKYRLICSSANTHTNSVLTAGQESFSIWGNWQNQGNNSTTTNGTFITGGLAADGFDTQLSQASLYTYDDVNRRYIAWSTANGKNTKYTSLKAGVAYFMFVYGDRTNSIGATNPRNTKIKAFGDLVTGTQLYNTSSTLPLSSVTNRYTLLGNPYACSIDWATLAKQNIASTYWGWDPNLSGSGGYVTVNTAGNVTIIAPYSGSTQISQYIQPGQGFFVKTTAASPSLTIREQDKVINANPLVFRTLSSLQLLAVNLQYSSSGSMRLADGVVAVFDSSFSNAITDEDATHLDNGYESLAIRKNTDTLSIEARPLPSIADTIKLYITGLTKTQYNLQIFTQQLALSNRQMYLYDKYLNSNQIINLNDTNNFVINTSSSIPASVATDRFCIVLRPVTILPINNLQFRGYANSNNSINLNWIVPDQSDILGYVLQRSCDGQHYSNVTTINNTGNGGAGNYNFTDNNPCSGNNFYRLQINTLSNNPLTSKTISVQLTQKQTLRVSPNPVTAGFFNAEISGLKESVVTYALYNMLGEELIRKTFAHPGGFLKIKVYTGSILSAGKYTIRVFNNEENFTQPVYIFSTK